MVAGQQNGLNANLVQRGDHIPAFLSHSIGKNKVSGKNIIHRDVDHGASRIQIGVCFGRNLFRDGDSLQKLQIARFHRFPADDSQDALAKAHLEAFAGSGLFTVTADDRFAERMLTQLLGCGGKIKYLVRCVARNGLHSGNLGRTVGKGARFIKGNLSHCGKPFQSVAFPDEKTVFRGVADCRHDRGRRCQHQGAGAEHNKNGDRPDDFTGERPGKPCRRKSDNDDPCGPSVCKPDDLGLSRVGRLHQPDHTLDGAVFADLGSPHFKSAELVHRTGGYLVARRFIHRKRFPCHDRLIYRGLSGKDDAVNRNGFAGQNTDHIPDFYLFGRDDRFCTVQKHSGSLRSQVDKLFDAGPRLCNRQILQQRAQLHDESHFACGKILADADRGNKRQRYQHVGLDVKSGNQPDYSLHNDWYAAKDNGDPRRVEGQREQIKQADN